MDQKNEDSAQLESLANLLRRRLEVIADHAWRDSDPDAHLEALKSVSLEIGSVHESFGGELPGRLEHFLTKCSFDKALAYLEGDVTSE